MEHLEEGGASVEGWGHDPDHLKKERVGGRLKSLSLLLVSPWCKSHFKKERGHRAQALLPQEPRPQKGGHRGGGWATGLAVG